MGSRVQGCLDRHNRLPPLHCLCDVSAMPVWCCATLIGYGSRSLICTYVEALSSK